MLRRLRRRFRVLTVLPAAWWVWKERHVLAGMAGFARTVPDRLRLGRGGEVALAAKVNLALLREPRLQGTNVRLGAVQDGDVCLEAGPASATEADIARRVVEQVPGVTSVRIENPDARVAPSRPVVVAGSAAVDDLQDGKVDAGPAGEDVPVQI